MKKYRVIILLFLYLIKGFWLKASQHDLRELAIEFSNELKQVSLKINGYRIEDIKDLKGRLSSVRQYVFDMCCWNNQYRCIIQNLTMQTYVYGNIVQNLQAHLVECNNKVTESIMEVKRYKQWLAQQKDCAQVWEVRYREAHQALESKISENKRLTDKIEGLNITQRVSLNVANITIMRYKIGTVLLLVIISFLLADKCYNIGSMLNLQFS